jgi:pimeloyl-ACP methyl ester carboxylesterase
MSLRRLTALLLAATLGGCAIHRPGVGEMADPGRLPSATQVVRVAGLRPCNDGAERALTIDPASRSTSWCMAATGPPGSFHALAEVLAFHGQQSACLAYNDRDSLMVSSGQLAHAVDTLALHLNTPQITVIGHSMGGLVARKALVADRPEARAHHADRPASGDGLGAVFRHCRGAHVRGAALRVATLGLNDLVCWLISGDNWYEITSASDFIQKPGSLAAQVSRHLKVVTDERDSCRRRSDNGRCIEERLHFQPERTAAPAGHPRSPRPPMSRSSPGTSKSSANPASRRTS